MFIILLQRYERAVFLAHQDVRQALMLQFSLFSLL